MISCTGQKVSSEKSRSLYTRAECLLEIVQREISNHCRFILKVELRRLRFIEWIGDDGGQISNDVPFFFSYGHTGTTTQLDLPTLIVQRKIVGIVIDGRRWVMDGRDVLTGGEGRMTTR